MNNVAVCWVLLKDYTNNCGPWFYIQMSLGHIETDGSSFFSWYKTIAIAQLGSSSLMSSSSHPSEEELNKNLIVSSGFVSKPQDLYFQSLKNCSMHNREPFNYCTIYISIIQNDLSNCRFYDSGFRIEFIDRNQNFVISQNISSYLCKWKLNWKICKD